MVLVLVNNNNNDTHTLTPSLFCKALEMNCFCHLYPIEINQVIKYVFIK